MLTDNSKKLTTVFRSRLFTTHFSYVDVLNCFEFEASVKTPTWIFYTNYFKTFTGSFLHRAGFLTADCSSYNEMYYKKDIFKTTQIHKKNTYLRGICINTNSFKITITLKNNALNWNVKQFKYIFRLYIN